MKKIHEVKFKADIIVKFNYELGKGSKCTIDDLENEVITQLEQKLNLTKVVTETGITLYPRFHFKEKY